MLEYLQSELGLAYRTRLTRHALGTYLDPPDGRSTKRAVEGMERELMGSTGDDGKGEQLFYKLANLDDRIKNADQVSQACEKVTVRLCLRLFVKALIRQYLTVDIQQFSSKLAEIYSNIAKPVLDVM